MKSDSDSNRGRGPPRGVALERAAADSFSDYNYYVSLYFFSNRLKAHSVKCSE